MSWIVSLANRCRSLAVVGALLTAAVPLAGSAQDAPASAAPAPEVEEAPAPPREPTPAVSTYRINVGDELEIYVWGEERLQRTLRVLPDGTIAFPLVGQLRVQGQLPQDVERQVSDRLRDQYRGEVPFVTVSVGTPGMQFSVMGKVRSPGVFNAPRYVNVLDALSLAGGPAEFASLDNVLIVSHRGDQLVSTTVRLAALFKAGARNADIERAGIVQLSPGDVIIVP